MSRLFRAEGTWSWCSEIIYSTKTPPDRCREGEDDLDLTAPFSETLSTPATSCVITFSRFPHWISLGFSVSSAKIFLYCLFVTCPRLCCLRVLWGGAGARAGGARG